MHRISVEFRPIINKIVISNPERNSSRGLAVPEKTGHIIPEILRDEEPFISELQRRIKRWIGDNTVEIEDIAFY